MAGLKTEEMEIYSSVCVRNASSKGSMMPENHCPQPAQNNV
jgi:hypothetical protein